MPGCRFGVHWNWLPLLQLNFSVAQDDLRGRGRGVRGWNHRKGVIGSHQRGCRWNLVPEASRWDFLLFQWLLHVDDKVGHLGILGILGYGDLDHRGIGVNDDSRNRRDLILQHGPELVGVFLY